MNYLWNEDDFEGLQDLLGLGILPQVFPQANGLDSFRAPRPNYLQKRRIAAQSAGVYRRGTSALESFV